MDIKDELSFTLAAITRTTHMNLINFGLLQIFMKANDNFCSFAYNTNTRRIHYDIWWTFVLSSFDHGHQAERFQASKKTCSPSTATKQHFNNKKRTSVQQRKSNKIYEKMATEFDWKQIRSKGITT